MSNRSYLASSDQDTLYPSSSPQRYNAALQTIANDVGAVPLLWIALFRPGDLRSQTFEIEGQRLTVEAPICERASAIRQLEAALPLLNTLFAAEGPLDGYVELMKQALHDVPYRFVTIEMQEVGWLWNPEAEFYDVFRRALQALAGPADPAAKRLFLDLSQLREGQPWPSPRIYLDQLPYTADEQWSFTRLLGAGAFGSMGIGRQVPWESEDAEYGFEIVGYDDEE